MAPPRMMDGNPAVWRVEEEDGSYLIAIYSDADHRPCPPGQATQREIHQYDCHGACTLSTLQVQEPAD